MNTAAAEIREATKRLEYLLSYFDHANGVTKIPEERPLFVEVYHLLAKRVDVNGSSGSGLSPVAAAISRNYVRIAATLLENHANPRWTDNYGRNLLHYAAQHNCSEIVSVLKAKGVSETHRESINGLTPLELAIADKRSDVVKALGGKESPAESARVHKIMRAHALARMPGLAFLLQTPS
jgi:ankyrin repeat protein